MSLEMRYFVSNSKAEPCPFKAKFSSLEKIFSIRAQEAPGQLCCPDHSKANRTNQSIFPFDFI